MLNPSVDEKLSKIKWQEYYEMENKLLIYKIASTNYELLNRLILSYGDGEYSTLLFRDMDVELESFNFQLAFLMFNFLNSSISILEQVESTYEEVYRKKGLIPDYITKTNIFWGVNENIIVRGLRNLTSHTSSSFTTTRMSQVIGEKKKYILIINKKAIEAYEDWEWGKSRNVKPRKLILETSEDLELGSLFGTFFINTTEYFHWFFSECMKYDADSFIRIFGDI